MIVKRLLIFFCSVFLLAGCTNDNKESQLAPTSYDDLELAKLSSYDIYDQNPANSAKQMLSTYDELKQIRAVNDHSMVVIAVDVEQDDRFFLDDIEKNLRRKMNKHFSELSVTLSTDKKILLELERLEKQLESDNITNEELSNQLKKINKLSKEQT